MRSPFQNKLPNKLPNRLPLKYIKLLAGFVILGFFFHNCSKPGFQLAQDLVGNGTSITEQSTSCSALPKSVIGSQLRTKAPIPPVFRPGEVKVRIHVQKAQAAIGTPNSPAQIKKISNTKTVGRSNYEQASSDLILAKGFQALVLYDHNCQKGSDSRLVSNQMDSQNSTEDIEPVGHLNSKQYQVRNHRLSKLTLNKDTPISELETLVQNNPCVIGVSENSMLKFTSAPNDPGFTLQHHHRLINTAPAWDKFYGNGGILPTSVPVIAAVVDSGVNYRHTDLVGAIWSNAKGEHGYDFVNDDSDPIDDNGHGSHVAGLIGAVANNGVGGSGVMGSQIKIMAVKVMDSTGSGDLATVLQGVNYAVDNGAQIINLSLGGGPPNAVAKQVFETANSKGVFLVFAAGNEHLEMTPTGPFAPGLYAQQLSGALAVASVDAADGSFSTQFSNFSPTMIEIAAPGDDTKTGAMVGTVVQRGLMSTFSGGINAYKYDVGTSMATPVVVGAVGLTIGVLKARNYAYTPELLKSIILAGSAVNPTLNTKVSGGKTLDLQSLINYIDLNFPAPVTPPTPPPNSSAPPVNTLPTGPCT